MLKREQGAESNGKLPQIFIPSKTATLGRPRRSRDYHTRHLIRGSRVQARPVSMDFSERKNPEYDFLRKGSKTVGSVS